LLRIVALQAAVIIDILSLYCRALELINYHAAKSAIARFHA
jgi:hypothetical protein